MIVDDLRCEYQPNWLGIVEILSRVFSIQNLQLLIIQEPTGELPTEDIDGQDLLAFKDPDPKELEEFHKEKAEIIAVFTKAIVEHDTQEAGADRVLGIRIVNEIPCTLRKSELLEIALEIVPFPVFPDPVSLPLPPLQVWQIVSKPRNRQKPAAIAAFTLLTPINKVLQEGSEEPSKRMDLADENLDRSRGRWIIDPNISTYLLVKFFSPEIDSFEANMQFEIVGCTKHFNLPFSVSASSL